MQAIEHDEITLNGVAYPIVSQLQQFLVGNFPPKMVIGDYTKDSNPETSTWAISDNRGGALSEEFNEATDQTRFWTANCWTKTRGHLTALPKFSAATIDSTSYYVPTHTNLGLANWTSGGSWTADNWTCAESGGTLTPYNHPTTPYTGAKLSSSASPGGTASLYSDATNYASCKGKNIYLCYTVNYNSAATMDLYVEISDGVDTTSHKLTGSSAVRKFVLKHAVNANATRVRVKLYCNGGDTGNGSIYNLSFLSPSGNPSQFVEFNDNLYLSYGNSVFKLNTSSGTAFDLVMPLPATITRMIPSINSKLYIFLGDTENYWHMTTAEAFTYSNSALAYFGVQWDNKLLKFSSTGEGHSSVDPDATSPTWTDCGSLTDMSAADIANRHPFVYSDVSGNDVLYWATRKGFKSHDFSGTQWVDTKLVYPSHPNGGRGACYWRGQAYIPSGLDIIGYGVGVPASISSIGLNTSEGMPSTLNGEIVKLYGSYTDLYAMVDSSQTTGTGYSSIYMWDGTGWHCLYVDSSSDQAWYDMITSSAKGYRIWIAGGAGVQYLEIGRGISNPNQVIPWSYYNTSGTYVTPWFDALWYDGSKIAISLKLFLKDADSTHYVKVSYRLDREYTDYSSGWSTLITKIEEEGLTEYAFKHGEGVPFKAIQFKFEFTNPSSSTTSADILYFAFTYLKVLPPSWGWKFTVDCTKEYRERTESQLIAALQEASLKDTLVPFVVDDVTNYVRVKDVTSVVENGEVQEGVYQVTLIKPV